MSICLFVLLLVLQSPVKPDGNGTQSNDTSKRKTEPPIAATDNPKRGELRETKIPETPERDNSIEWANWFLVVVGALTGYAIWRQAQIAKNTLIAMQRPRLSIKHIFVIPPGDITGKGDSREWRIGCIIANVGGSKAEVTESNLTVKSLGIGTIERLLPASPVYENKYSFGKFALQPGERRQINVALDTNTDGNMLRVTIAIARKVDRGGQIPHDTNPTVFYGYFKYRDDSGIDRLSGFGWQFNRINISLARLDHPDYEYED